MKNIATILTTAVWALVLATACSKSETNVQVSGVELDRKTLTLTVGDGGDLTATLTATVVPTGATNKAVTWSSSDHTVATVDADGKVTAVSGGEAEITVTTRDGGKEASCTVTVDHDIVNPDLVNLLDPQYIPDAGFLKYCEGQMAAWNTDGYVGLSFDEAAAVKTMSIADIGAVRSLKGIEHFTGLETLECRGLNNDLSVLNLTNNAALRKLVCEGGSLTRLNVSGCAALETLDVSGCPNLNELNCFSNRLTALDVSKCPTLTFLNVDDNRLASLNVSQNTSLLTLYCKDNTLTSLNVSGCAALKSLDVTGNKLTSLNVSSCAALTDLKCSNNDRLGSLSLSNCTALRSLTCYGNGLTALDVSNCTLLTALDCHANSLTALNVSGCPALTSLDCYNNQLTALDVSNCVLLDYLDCFNNRLTALNVSQNAALELLSCGTNLLTELDLTDNDRLVLFSCGANDLSVLTVGMGHDLLESFECQNNELSAAALDDIFGSLPDIGPEGPTYSINVSGNPGTATCNVALAKNWTVVKDLLRKR